MWQRIWLRPWSLLLWSPMCMFSLKPLRLSRLLRMHFWRRALQWLMSHMIGVWVIHLRSITQTITHLQIEWPDPLLNPPGHLKRHPAISHISYQLLTHFRTHSSIQNKVKELTLDTTDIQNYRLISFLSFLSKTLECAIPNQLSSKLSQINLAGPSSVSQLNYFSWTSGTAITTRKTKVDHHRVRIRVNHPAWTAELLTSFSKRLKTYLLRVHLDSAEPSPPPTYCVCTSWHFMLALIACGTFWHL